MTQDDFNDIHSAIMDAIVDHGDSFGDEGEPESPQEESDESDGEERE